MNNIKDINIKIYSRDELQSAKASVLKKIMNDYSIKRRRLKQDMIDDIIQYQDNISELKHKLEDDSHSIDNYHRGTVSYSLPTIIIYRIIRDLWHHEILETKYTLSPSLKDIQEDLQQLQQLQTDISQNQTQIRLTYQTSQIESERQLEIARLRNKINENCSKINNLTYGSTPGRSLQKSYQWLLSLAVLSKEFFKLISTSLFTSFKLVERNYSENDLMLKTIITNPYNVMKNITTLSVHPKVLNKISSMNNAAELKLIFGNVERLIIKGKDNKIYVKYFGLIGNAMSKLQHLQIEPSIDTIKMEIIQKNFHSIISLDLSMSYFEDITFDMNLLPPNLSILYLPKERKTKNDNNNSKNSKSNSKLSSNCHNITEIGIQPSHMYISKFLTKHLKKLYIPGNDESYERNYLPDELFKFIDSDKCNLTKLTFNFNIFTINSTKYWELKKLLSFVNKSKITTFKLICHNNDNLLGRKIQPDAMNKLFNLIVPIENIKRLILGFNKTNYLLEHLTHTANNVQVPTGFIITSNNRITTDEYQKNNLYHLKRIDLSNNNTTDGTYEIISYNPIPGEIEELTNQSIG